ncbi:pollen-specific leucine-rich repeat extensin-like protein 1 [Cryptomeria japonica]|uniref:pollen-specific leucine-rich repeat extensin-like protein 1 n=1 Tax=Cryptomeria japonica TaxID=3369 RepID=UPI0027D9F377|nr:pollen-specific leucine-rich repeat extensin-like protein 1 [Cryptomeria japonica]
MAACQYHFYCEENRRVRVNEEMLQSQIYDPSEGYLEHGGREGNGSDAPVFGLNPEPCPAQAEEAQASAPPKKEKRKREEKKASVVVSKEEAKEEAPTPKSRKPTPGKRKSKKDGEVGASAKEIPTQPTPRVTGNEEVEEKMTEEPPKKKETKKRSPPKKKVEFAPIIEETLQPQEEPIALVEPPRTAAEVEREQ